MRHSSALVSLVLVSGLVLSCSPQNQQPEVDPAYFDEIEEWHGERVERLSGSEDWLTVVGLHWIEEGENTFGTDASNTVALPEAAGVGVAGSIFLENGAVRAVAREGVDLKLHNEPFTEGPLISDADGPPDVLSLADITFYVIQRGDRFAVRVKDPNSEARKNFTGVDRFPVNEKYRFEAEFVPYDPPQERLVPTVIGTTVPYQVPGVVKFEVDGAQCELEPVLANPDSPILFFIFGDLTNGVESYGAGRFLYAEREKDGKVLLDFNRAVNPPCAFTPYATCPLPPPENRLSVRIEAGELAYGHH
jgi:uncharacterized protein (DUF1684 family)